MARNSRQKSASSGSSSRRPSPRKPPAASAAKIRKLPASKFEKKPTRRSGTAAASPKKKSIFSRFKKDGQRGRHSVSLDSGSSAPSRPAPTMRADSAASPSVRLEGQTIAQIKEERKRQIAAEERRERSKKRKRRARIPLIIMGIVSALGVGAIGAYFVLSNTDTFKIESIDISGTDHLTTQEVSALVSVPQGTTLFNIDADAIIASLKRDAWVEDVDVNKVFPNELQIVVHERAITAVAEIPMGENQEIQKWAISNDGYWLMAIPDRDTELGAQISEQIHADADRVLHIDDLEYGIQPEIGAKCTDPAVLNALAIISGMTTSLANQVKVVEAPDVDSTMLVLKNNVEIAFGEARDIRDKERICLQIIKDNPKVVYINVRVIDRPTWRSA